MPKNDAVVDPVSGKILETQELRDHGLQQLRALMKVSQG